MKKAEMITVIISGFVYAEDNKSYTVTATKVVDKRFNTSTKKYTLYSESTGIIPITKELYDVVIAKANSITISGSTGIFNGEQFNDFYLHRLIG